MHTCVYDNVCVFQSTYVLYNFYRKIIYRGVRSILILEPWIFKHILYDLNFNILFTNNILLQNKTTYLLHFTVLHKYESKTKHNVVVDVFVRRTMAMPMAAYAQRQTWLKTRYTDNCSPEPKICPPSFCLPQQSVSLKIVLLLLSKQCLLCCYLFLQEGFAIIHLLIRTYDQFFGK